MQNLWLCHWCRLRERLMLLGKRHQRVEEAVAEVRVEDVAEDVAGARLVQPTTAAAAAALMIVLTVMSPQQPLQTSKSHGWIKGIAVHVHEVVRTARVMDRANWILIIKYF